MKINGQIQPAMANKICLVTGATSKMGRATAAALAEKGRNRCAPCAESPKGPDCA